LSACNDSPQSGDSSASEDGSTDENENESDATSESNSDPETEGSEESTASEESDSTIPSDVPEMVEIPAGSFMMGCHEETAPIGCASKTLPYHEVELSAYAIDTFEVTIEDYEDCVTDGKCGPALEDCLPDPPPNAPRTCVSWFNAQAYCMYRGKRLPTEAEWERAFRGDSTDVFPWGNNIPTNCESDAMYGKRVTNTMVEPWCGTGKAQPVGSRPHDRSPYGVYDMAGSVSEWVQDFYDEKYYANSPKKDPQGPEMGGEGTATARVQRGASAGFDPGEDVELQLTWRWSQGQNGGSSHSGFRCAKSL
jgi:iron(II)-dependent oxidoreductase